MPRGTLRIYLGAAPGVGKTYAALDEAHRRAERGADLLAVHVARSDGLTGADPSALARQRALVESLGDHDNTTGVGLGLALSRGLTEAMDGTLTPDETPGGGLTMVLSLPAAPSPVMAPQDAPSQPTAQEPEPSVGP